ncbi:MAG: ATP-dependent zinc metalloprotease FtsH [Acidimicrobiales bacterium]
MGVLIPLLIAAYISLFFIVRPQASGRKANFSYFAQEIGTKHVSSITLLAHDNRALFIIHGTHYWTSLVGSQTTGGSSVTQNVISEAVSEQIPVNVDQQSIKDVLVPVEYTFPYLILIASLVLIYLVFRPGSGTFTRARARKEAGQPVTFADVAGLDEAILELKEVRDYLLAPDRFKVLGAEVPRGVLLVGPPGTGKTLLARAVAGEVGAQFLSMSGADFNEMYVGVGASRVRDLFRQAREATPTILFIDELDAVGRSRTGSMENAERDQTVNQLLVEMDGFGRVPGVVLIGATNRPDVLDPALLRPGRFDRQIVIDKPDRSERLAILAVHARKKPLRDSVSLPGLASETSGLTGADLAAVLNEAAILASRRGDLTISELDVEDGLDRVLNGSTVRAQALTAAEKRVVAHHEAGHALVAWAVPGGPAVTKISIVARGTTLGRSSYGLEDRRPVISRSELESRLAVHLAGLAAEQRFLGDMTTGPSDDLQKASTLARQMVCELGMSERIGRVTLSTPSRNYLGDGSRMSDVSQVTAAEVDAEVRRMLDVATQRASAVLADNAAVLERLVEALLVKETLREPELVPFIADIKKQASKGAPQI